MGTDRTTSISTPSSCPPCRQDELHAKARSLDPHPPQDCFSQCYRLLPQCCPHAEGRELLREAAPWPSSRARGQGSSRTLPEEVHGQEPFSKAPRSRHWLPDRHRLRAELLLPSPPPQEQRALSGSSECAASSRANRPDVYM